MRIYAVTVVRSGGWWAIDVPEVRGVHTQARRLDQVEAMARDAIAGTLAIDPDTFAVDVQPEIPDVVAEALAARRTAREADERAETATRQAVAKLLKEGLTVRDAGTMLALSPQRVSQIANRAA